MNKFSFIPKNIIVAISLATLIVNVIKSCPVVCTCKWKGGKRKVECTDRNLTSLLTNIESETQVLNYSNNDLRTLDEGAFEKVNLIHLQKLYVAACRITTVHEAAFRGLSNLIELDLSANALATIPSQSFYHVPLLMKLIVSANPVRVLESGSFVALKHLATLDATDCQLEEIEHDAFDGLRKLEWLKLEGNQLKTIKQPRTLLPPVTGGISLHRNPWRCDCNLRTFHAWLTATANSSNALPRLLVRQPVCAEPANYRGSTVSSLKTADLACAPYVVPSSLFVEINEGTNISFVCQVSAVPEARITWEFEGNPIDDSGGGGNSSFVYPFYKYYAEDATTEQVSELFVVEATKENNGTYRCTAQNVAGKSASNYTLSVIGLDSGQTDASDEDHRLRSYVYVLVSSFSTLMLIVLVTLIVISYLTYASRKKQTTSGENKSGSRSGGDNDVEYEIVKQSSAAKEVTAPKSDTNPDLIINTEGNGGRCERLLLLPPSSQGDVQETYFSLADDVHLYGASDVNLVPCGASVATTAAAAGTINLYLAPSNPVENFRNLYVNPFDGFVEQNCWTLQLTEKNELSQQQQQQRRRRHVLIDCCNQPVCQKQTISNAACEFVNLRHNLEGYPYPSKLKLTSPEAVNGDVEEKVRTPILSPPDPFKTSIATFELKNL